MVKLLFGRFITNRGRTSNAVCVFIGQAYDLYHPNVLVYDFEEDSMAPKLLIKNSEKGKPMVSLP